MNSGPGDGAAGDGEDRPPDEQHEPSDVDWEQRVAEVSDEVDRESAEAAPASRFDSWRRRSAAGAIMTGIARGLQQVFEKEREEQTIVQETSGDPPTDLPVEAEVKQGRARHSIVNIRPWLLHRHAGGEAPRRPVAEGGAQPADPGETPRPAAGEGSAGPRADEDG